MAKTRAELIRQAKNFLRTSRNANHYSAEIVKELLAQMEQDRRDARNKPGGVNELVLVLADLTRVFTEGRNYTQQNPYARPEVKAALESIGRATGQNGSYLDVQLPQRLEVPTCADAQKQTKP